MSKFQIIFLGLFAGLAVSGLVFFSVYKGNNSKTQQLVSIWGTVDSGKMTTYLDTLVKQVGTKITIKYYQIPDTAIYSAYVESLISANGPDLLLLSQQQYRQFGGKLYLIPYKTISQETFKASYINAANNYLETQGIGALPFFADPMIMYWNRDIFTNALVARPPVSWADFVTLAPLITKKDLAYNITTSAVSLGEYANIDHAKDILGLLFMEAGSPIVAQLQNGSYGGGLAYNYGNGASASNALDFYTQFANPTQKAYTWNRALTSSKDLFIANRLGVYFGYAGEFNEISQKNPNLNFDVALMPQSKIVLNGQPLIMTYAKLYGISVAHSAKDPATAISVAQMLSSAVGSQLWSKTVGLPSDRRDTLDFNAADSKTSIFAQSAFWSQVWNDPNPNLTDSVFQTMIENVTSGKTTSNVAVQQADQRLSAELKPFQ